MRTFWATLLALTLLFGASPASAYGVARDYRHNQVASNVSPGAGHGSGWQGFSQTWVPGVITYINADLGMTAAMGPVTATGTSPPTITLSGTPTAPQATAATPYIEIDCTTLGILGTSRFTFKVNGAVTATNVASASSGVAITGTPITAGWATGASAVNDVYTAPVVAATLLDQSGHTNTFAQATNSLRPILFLLNGRAAIVFAQASSQVLVGSKATNTLLTGTSAEKIVIGKAIADPTSPGTNGVSDEYWGTDANGNYTPYSDGVVYDDFGSTARKNASGHAAGAMASEFVLDEYSAASDWRAFLNGKLFYSTATNTVGFGASAAELGYSYGQYGSMTFASVLVVNAQLDPSTRSRLVSYFGTYYAIPVTP